MANGGYSKKALPRFPKASSWKDRPLLSQPMDPAIPKIVSDIQFLLAHDLGWRRVAYGGLNDWLESRIHKEGADAKQFTTFWLPLLRELSLRHDPTSWKVAPQSSRQWHSSFFRFVLLQYLLTGVGREPRRREFCRPGFSPLETNGCSSCRTLDRFLLDRSRVRAIFLIVSETTRAAPSQAKELGHVLNQAALAHMLPLLAARKRNCAFHVKKSTCGAMVLCVEKRDGSKQWEDWRGRSDRAAGEMARFDKERLRLILGDGDFEALVGMEICRRVNKDGLQRMLTRAEQDKADREKDKADREQQRHIRDMLGEDADEASEGEIMNGDLDEPDDSDWW